ncbi:MAG: YhdH/YhfP family quinone oxidoreductase [Pseudomonadales bacterium]|nr:YhdH/YhfP family quinone oxidoreductase [Pseudomonadales bacterium]
MAGGQTEYHLAVVQRSIDELPPGEVLIRVNYSSLNYKDALSAHGNKGVSRNFPHTPGIDAAGVVIACDTAEFKAGDQVIVTGYDLGMNTSGGFGQYIRVPADWVLACPSTLSLRDAMITGTAGLTAALCVEKLLCNGLHKDAGPVLVTGASGGVGSYAVALLAKLGFRVTACTGKPEQETALKKLGASDVIARDSLTERSPKPLSREQWAGAVDVAGGEVLVNILKTLQYGGSVACCGLVASAQLPGTVFPFILRGVNLLGVDSVNLPLSVKADMWQKLASDWRLDSLQQLGREIGFEALIENLQLLYRGQGTGRIVLDLGR